MTQKLQNWLEAGRARLAESRHKLAMIGVSVLAVAMAYGVIFGSNGLLKYRYKRQEYQQLLQQNQSLESQKQAAEQRIKALKYDPKAIEKEARERLRYARKGEVIYTLPEARPAAQENHK